MSDTDHAQRLSVEAAAHAALMLGEPAAKQAAVSALCADWAEGRLGRAGASWQLARIEVPGRPQRPQLVPPAALPRRSPASPAGHAALLHAIAHIEFNAINLALDCVARFALQPAEFVDDWLRVAREEAYHFGLLCGRLAKLGFAYGDFDAHNGLWEMALKSDHDFLVRMALVPRVLEARGLDATPPIVARLQAAGDAATVAVLEIILRDEIGHVAVGDKWFRAACAERGLEAEAEYRRLIDAFDAPPPRPPLNRAARLAAGFSSAELDCFEALAQGPRGNWAKR